MKFCKSQINNTEIKELNGVVSFDRVCNNILELKDISVNTLISGNQNLIHVDFKINGNIKVRSSYTLKTLDYKLSFNDEIDISDDEKNLDTIYVKGNEVDLDSIIYDLIICHIPTRIYGKNEKCEVKGDGFSVMSEEEFRKQEEDNTSSPFDLLKDLDI